MSKYSTEVDDGSSIKVNGDKVFLDGGSDRYGLRHFDTLFNKKRWPNFKWLPGVHKHLIVTNVSTDYCNSWPRLQWFFAMGFESIYFDPNTCDGIDGTFLAECCINAMKKYPNTKFFMPNDLCGGHRGQELYYELNELMVDTRKDHF